MSGTARTSSAHRAFHRASRPAVPLLDGRLAAFKDYLWSPVERSKVILVPTDFSEPANRALDYALELAQALGATVKVMHAYELRPIDVLDGAFVSDERAVDRLKTAAQAAMEDNLARHDKRGVAVGSLLAVGETRDAIHAAAQDVGANLIVIGTHGRRGLSRALLGSVAGASFAPRRCCWWCTGTPKKKDA